MPDRRRPGPGFLKWSCLLVWDLRARAIRLPTSHLRGSASGPALVMQPALQGPCHHAGTLYFASQLVRVW